MKPLWITKSGKEIPIEELNHQHLVNCLRLCQKRAEECRRSLIEILPNDLEIQDHTWRNYVEPVFPHLELEAITRGLKWDEFENQPFVEEVTIEHQRGTLERKIVGALRNAIHAHGVITFENAHSAAKRVIGVIKAHNRETRMERRKT